MIDKAYLLNFGAPMTSGVLKAIQEKENISYVEQILIPRSIDLYKHSTYIQIHDIVESHKHYFRGPRPVIVNLPGLTIYAACLLTEISALTGRLPVIIECNKSFSSGGAFSEFKFKRLYNLDRERTVSREKYKGNAGCESSLE